MTGYHDFVAAFDSDNPPAILCENGMPIPVGKPKGLACPSYDFNTVVSQLDVDTINKLRDHAYDLGEHLLVPHERFALLFDNAGMRFLGLVTAVPEDEWGPFQASLWLHDGTAQWSYLGMSLLGECEVNFDASLRNLPAHLRQRLKPRDTTAILKTAGQILDAAMMLLHLRHETETLLTLTPLPQSDTVRGINRRREKAGEQPISTTKIIYVSPEARKRVLWLSEKREGHGTPKSPHRRGAYYRRPRGSPLDAPKTEFVRESYVKGGGREPPEYDVRLRRPA